MQKYLNLLMGLVSGLVLMFLNNEIVRKSIITIGMQFDPVSPISIFIIDWLSRIVILLSFIGIFITIIYAILILKRALKNNA